MSEFKKSSAKKTVKMRIPIPNDLLEEIEKVIKEENCTFNDFAVMAVEHALEDLKEKEENH